MDGIAKCAKFVEKRLEMFNTLPIQLKGVYN